jgi:minor extracellular serine protease Vpr
MTTRTIIRVCLAEIFSGQITAGKLSRLIHSSIFKLRVFSKSMEIIRKKFCFRICLFALAFALMQGMVSLLPGAGSQSVVANQNRISVIVELESPPVVIHEKTKIVQNAKIALESSEAQSYEAKLRYEHEIFKTHATLISSSLRICTEYHKLLNAVSLEASVEELATIARLPGVRRVRQTKSYHATLNKSLQEIRAPMFWQSLGGSSVAGQGMKIAILDSGIDISNPLFSDTGLNAPMGFPRGDPAFTNNKVIVAKAFLQNANATPADEFGHGTHISGIAAGDFDTPSPLARLSGVAPQAFLGNYRVLDQQGEGRDDLIIKALEEAMEDGFDVINMSFGGEADSELGALEIAIENAIAAGVVVVIAAGNQGEDGQMTIASPGIAPSAITVGATTNAHVTGPGANLTIQGAAPPSLVHIKATFGETDDKPVVLEQTFGPLRDIESTGNSDRGCAALPANSLSGKIALVERGDCKFSDKINNIALAGAKAAIIFNTARNEDPDSGDNLLFMNVTGTSIPAAFINHSNGLALRDWLRLQVDAQVTIAPIPITQIDAPSDLLSEFSSRGPSSIYELKPDLTAPGDPIYSGAIKDNVPGGVTSLSGFTTVSGTSQAAPHVAGAVALLKQQHPSWTPEQIKSALMNSATGINRINSKMITQAGTLDVGAGRLDLEKARSISALLSPASLSFGLVKLKKVNATAVLGLKIVNLLERRNKFTFMVQQVDSGFGVSVAPGVESLSLKAGQTFVLPINIVAVAGVAQRRDYTGYIMVTTRSGEMLRVPYWIHFVKN